MEPVAILFVLIVLYAWGVERRIKNIKEEILNLKQLNEGNNKDKQSIYERITELEVKHGRLSIDEIKKNWGLKK